MKIENIYTIQNNIKVVEIFNDLEENDTFDYYVLCPRFPMEYTFGVPVESERFNRSALMQMYDNGYFDYLDTVTEYMQDLTLDYYKKYMGV